VDQLTIEWRTGPLSSIRGQLHRCRTFQSNQGNRLRLRWIDTKETYPCGSL